MSASVHPKAHTPSLAEASSAADWPAALLEVTRQMPDARERLEYVGQMTERAAHKVLGIVEMAQPICREASAHCRSAANDLRSQLRNEVAEPAELRASLEAAYAAMVRCEEAIQLQSKALNDILMTQDFQDLSGQVIQKVSSIIYTAHGSLQGILAASDVEANPMRATGPNSATHLDGPQVPSKALAQGDVDDLLAELGF